MKLRLDKLLIDRKLVPTREKAQYLIMAGFVIADGQKIVKCGQLVNSEVTIELLKDFPKYVSRGGEKLEGAYKEFNFSVAGRTALDVGQSTGGFTDFLLQNNADFVIGVDVGYGQVDLKIRNHPQNLTIERANARKIDLSFLEKACKKDTRYLTFLKKIDLVVMDLSFISITKVLPVIKNIVQNNSDYIILVKPQFEAEKNLVGKGGVIRDPDTHKKILAQVEKTLNEQGFTVYQHCDSPITGTKGNKEFFFWLKNRI